MTTPHTPLALARKGLTATNHWYHTTPYRSVLPLFLSSLLDPCFQFQAIVFNFRWWNYAQPLVFNFRWWNFDMNFLDKFSTIFLGHKFLEKFDLGNFALFLWYYCCLIYWVFILYNDFTRVNSIRHMQWWKNMFLHNLIYMREFSVSVASFSIAG
jgi:hypothetical protein